MTDWFRYKDEESERRAWSSSGYRGYECPNCKRHRVRDCKNGNGWCEKCLWVVETGEYFKPDWEF